VQGLTSETGMISMVLVGLIAGVLWRKILPLGVKFFSVALLGGWVGHLGLYYTNLVVNMNSLENSTGTYPILGLMLGGLILIVLLWNFIQSKKRLSRLWGAVIVWMCAMLLIYIFRGIIV
jgi:Na+/melibiose symporter-like transporter